ncbi:MAG: PASTA domain-containing protein [Haliscomenobacter sp.]
MKIKTGIFFGGASRLRERSFLSARSYFTHLDRSVFDPLVFLITAGDICIHIDWERLFQPSLSDFFPPLAVRPTSAHPFPIYEESLPIDAATLARLAGRVVSEEELPQLINLGIIAMEGSQEAHDDWWLKLQQLGIPCIGNHALASRRARDFGLFQAALQENGIAGVPSVLVSPGNATDRHIQGAFQMAQEYIGFPMQIISTQDSERVAELGIRTTGQEFQEALDYAFFQESFHLEQWAAMSMFERLDYVRYLADLKNGPGFPVQVRLSETSIRINHPEALLRYFDDLVRDPEKQQQTVGLEGTLPVEPIRIQAKLQGAPFAMAVLRDTDGVVHTLPPMPLFSTDDKLPISEALVFDPAVTLQIQEAGQKLFHAFECSSLTLIQGVADLDGQVHIASLSYPSNYTTTGLLFRIGMAAGYSPVAWLTKIISLSLAERVREAPQQMSLKGLYEHLIQCLNQKPTPQGVAVLHTEAESGHSDTLRAWLSYLEATGSYLPVVCLLSYSGASLLLSRRQGETATPIAPLQLAQDVSVALLTELPGIPRGKAAELLERLHIPFNGPDAGAAGIANHRQHRLDFLHRNARIQVSEQFLLGQQVFEADPAGSTFLVESRFVYPLLAMTPEPEPQHSPLLIQNRSQLEAAIRLRFRPVGTSGHTLRRLLHLPPEHRLDAGDSLLFQEIALPKGAAYLLACTVLTNTFLDEEGALQIQHFPPKLRPSTWYPETGIELSAAVVQSLHATADQVSRQLQLWGYGETDFVVRIFENGSSNHTLEDVRPYPEWSIEGQLCQQLIQAHTYPGTALSQLLSQSIDRAKWKILQKEAQSAYLAAWKSPYFTASVPEEAEEPAPMPKSSTMEPTTPPSEKRRNPLPSIPATGIVGMAQENLWEIWYFISSAIFLKNLVAMAMLGFILSNTLALGLKWYTRHGQHLDTDDYTEMSVREARQKARKRSFNVIVNDSIFVVDKPGGIVLDQTPEPKALIKKNRNIYLTITGFVPPLVTLPTLTGGNDDFEQYKKRLESMGIKARILERAFNAEYEENTILYLVYRGRRITAADLKKGVKIPKSSTVDFIVSIRHTGTVDIPSLVCLTYEEATFILRNNQLAIGAVLGPNEEPTPGLYVYKQEPEYSPNLKLNIGEQINLYLTDRRPEGCGEQ